MEIGFPFPLRFAYPPTPPDRDLRGHPPRVPEGERNKGACGDGSIPFRHTSRGSEDEERRQWGQAEVGGSAGLGAHPRGGAEKRGLRK